MSYMETSQQSYPAQRLRTNRSQAVKCPQFPADDFPLGVTTASAKPCGANWDCYGHFVAGVSFSIGPVSPKASPEINLRAHKASTNGNS